VRYGDGALVVLVEQPFAKLFHRVVAFEDDLPLEAVVAPDTFVVAAALDSA
jgi:hypothetical protein